jgi:hypothetical protein
VGLSICTQLLDWNFGLKEALPTWLKFPCDEIIIFDFSFGKEAAKDVVDQFPDSRIKLFVPTSPTHFNTSVGRNISINLATNDMIFYMDSDVKITNPIDTTNIKHDTFMQGCVSNDGIIRKNGYVISGHYWLNGVLLGNYIMSLSGSCILLKKHFELLNGFDERMQGWGYNDYDFYNRLVKSGHKRIDFPNNVLQHIDHENEIRVKNFSDKSINVSDSKNKEISKLPWTINNKQINIDLKQIV